MLIIKYDKIILEESFPWFAPFLIYANAIL